MYFPEVHNSTVLNYIWNWRVIQQDSITQMFNVIDICDTHTSSHAVRSWESKGWEVLGFKPGSMDFPESKNSEYDFIRKGSKAVGPVSLIYGK